ncbi:MAG TPA: hypothetical protein VGK74_10705 [Symbiobacteriaceae bacterium]|jgi:hypothetical protein
MADTAMARGDYLNAVRYAVSASAAPKGHEEIRCDAYLTLAHATLAMELPGEALSFAVGAHLTARWARDSEREERASAVVALIMAHHPNLGEDRIVSIQH